MQRLGRHFASGLSLLLFSVAFVPVAKGEGRAAESKLEGLRRAAKAYPGDVDASLSLGKALRRGGLRAAALTELSRGQNLPGGRTGERGIRLRYEAARVLIDDRKFREALSACAKVESLAGGEALGHACAGAAHMMRKRASEALPEAQKALEISPGLYEAKIVVADAFCLDGVTVKAEESLREAIASDPKRPEAYLRLGELYEAQGKREPALEAFQKARAVDPDEPDAAGAVGRLLPPDKSAAEALDAAVAIRPSFTAAWSKLAEVRLGLGELSEAEKAATMAVSLEPKLADAHVMLARVYVTERRPDDALKEARAALAIVGNLASAKLLEADALVQRGDLDFALEAYQTAFGYARSDPTALVHAAQSCLSAGRETSAKGFADHATQLFPKWGPGWLVLGDVLAKGKEVAPARAAYKNALASEGPVDRTDVERKLGALK